MRKLKNTLYITSPNAVLSKDGENIVVKIDGREVGRRPIHILENIVCFNYTGMSGALIRLCSDHGVAVSLMDAQGRFCGRYQGKVSGNVLLRRTQYRIADCEETALSISRNMILAKLVNSKRTLNRTLRDHSEVIDTALLSDCIARLSEKIESAKEASSFQSLRGIEGAAAECYFSAFNEMILHQKDDFAFRGRSRRPPLDPVNAMLSYVYTLLAIDCQNALETVGIDPYVGFFHTDRPGRAGLALDMEEEFRAYLGDRFVLSLINRKQICGSDFVQKENGAVLFSDAARNKLLAAWQKRKQETIEHPYLKEKVEIGLLPYCQAMLLSSFLRGDLPDYPPFFVQ